MRNRSLPPPEVQQLQVLRALLPLRLLLLLPLPPALTDAVWGLLMQEVLRALPAGAQLLLLPAGAQLLLHPGVLVVQLPRRLRARPVGSAFGIRRASLTHAEVRRTGSVCSARPRAGSARVLTRNHCWARLTRH